MCDGVGVQGLYSRYEPPLVEESARVLDPVGGEQPFASAEVLGDGCEQGVIARVPGCNGFGSDEALTLVDRSTFD